MFKLTYCPNRCKYKEEKKLLLEFAYQRSILIGQFLGMHLIIRSPLLLCSKLKMKHVRFYPFISDGLFPLGNICHFWDIWLILSRRTNLSMARFIITFTSIRPSVHPSVNVHPGVHRGIFVLYSQTVRNTFFIFESHHEKTCHRGLRPG